MALSNRNYPPRVSVVCPFYNEEAIIEDAFRRIAKNLERDLAGKWDLTLVDDGSTDNSLELLLEAIGETNHDKVTVLSLAKNQGRGRALKAGIESAKGDIIVTTEIDCSWGDDIVERLVNEFNSHPETDFVVASPSLKGGGLVNVPAKRVFLTKWGNRLIRIFFSSGLTMNTGMTRAYRQHIIKPLVVHENEKGFHLEVLLKLLTLGFQAREIPAVITWGDHKRPEGRAIKRQSSTNIPQTIANHLRFLAIAQPVRYFTALALVTFLMGGGFITTAFWMLFTGGAAVFLALIGLLMFLFSLLFAGFAVVFFQFREVLREQWMTPYPRPFPPSSAPACRVFPS